MLSSNLPKPIAFSQLPELYGDDTGKCRAHESSLQRPFAHTTREQIDVIYSGINSLEPD